MLQPVWKQQISDFYRLTTSHKLADRFLLTNSNYSNTFEGGKRPDPHLWNTHFKSDELTNSLHVASITLLASQSPATASLSATVAQLIRFTSPAVISSIAAWSHWKPSTFCMDTPFKSPSLGHINVLDSNAAGHAWFALMRINKGALNLLKPQWLPPLVLFLVHSRFFFIWDKKDFFGGVGGGTIHISCSQLRE